MFSFVYNHLKIRISVFSLPSNESIYVHRERVLDYEIGKLHYHVSSPEQTDRVLAVDRANHVLLLSCRPP